MQAQLLSQCRVVTNAHSHDHQIGVQLRAVFEFNLAYAAAVVADQRSRLRAHAELHTARFK